jgi:raffinose/stachyose/melibiose transport system permease protein
MIQPATVEIQPPRRSAGRSKRGLRSLWPFLFLLPTFVFLVAFAYGPFVKVIVDSLYYWDGAFTRRLVGLTNYQQILFKDPQFWPAIGVALKLTLAGLVKILIFPLLAAEMIHLLRLSRSAYWYRVLLILPTVVPGLIIIFIWRLFYHPDPMLGLFNRVLYGLGGDSATMNWLGDPNIALWSLILMGFPWAGGFAMLVYLAGLQSIPSELYDAAAMDGATHWRRFWNIDLPLIRGQIKVLVVLTIIGGLQDFSAPFVMTNGGPLNATLVPGPYLYRQAFQANKYGYASAMALILFVIMMTFSVLNMRFVNSKVEY